MAALLAKLKLNKPPAIKKDMEINIRGNINAKKVVQKKKEDGRDKEEEADEADEADEDEIQEKQMKGVKIIDESNKKFDRDTFLKSFKKTKVINTLLPIEPIVEEIKPIPKTRKPKTIKERR